MNRPPWCRIALLFAVVSRLGAAQSMPVRAPGGVLRGAVQDSATGLPVGFALVIAVERNERAFASEGGRFTLTGLGSGAATLRIQQIGYRAVTLPLTIDASPGPAGAPGLVIRLSRSVVVLPEIVVRGDICTGASQLSDVTEEGILAEVFKNAERLLTLQQDYPFQETYQELTALLDSLGAVAGSRVDTGHYDSRHILRYQRGRVTVRDRSAIESALYFQPSDLARDEFRRTHCFWYAGTDSLYGFQAYRIQFAPLAKVRSIDWAGSLLIDSASMVLLGSEAHLVNLPRRGTIFVSAGCTLLYKQVFPTLVTPQDARCVSNHRSKPPTTAVIQWRLIGFRFLQRTPSDSEPQRP